MEGRNDTNTMQQIIFNNLRSDLNFDLIIQEVRGTLTTIFWSFEHIVSFLYVILWYLCSIIFMAVMQAFLYVSLHVFFVYYIVIL